MLDRNDLDQIRTLVNEVIDQRLNGSNGVQAQTQFQQMLRFAASKPPGTEFDYEDFVHLWEQNGWSPARGYSHPITARLSELARNKTDGWPDPLMYSLKEEEGRLKHILTLSGFKKSQE